MSQQQINSLLLDLYLLLGLNLGNFILHNYDKLLGSMLTLISIGYMIWKWRNEYKRSKVR